MSLGRISNRLVTFAFLVAQIPFAGLGCSSANDAPQVASENSASTSNGVGCDVDYTTLNTAGIASFHIVEPTSEKIAMPERIRHLNEMAAMPQVMRDMFANVPLQIDLTGGSITQFPEFASLSGVTPEGWPAGTTWDTVPGTATNQAVFLGDSGLGNNAYSLATHESTHTVDMNVSLTDTSTALQALYQADKARDQRTDSLTVYRLSLIREYLAVGVDEYSCNATTKAALQTYYPGLYSYIQNDFANELAARSPSLSGNATAPVAAAAPPACEYTCANYAYAEGECRAGYTCENACLVWTNNCP